MTSVVQSVTVSEPPCKNIGCNDYLVEPKVLYPWKEQCPPPKPWKPCESPLCPLEIERRSEDAVVRIFTQTNLTKAPVGTVPATLSPYIGSPGQDSLNSFDTYYTYGNGFRTKNGLIVCPAHLVLLPPNVLQYYTTFPNIKTIEPRPDGNALQRVGRILLDVFNVNGSGHSFTYEAHLYGVDGANDTALLYIPGPSSPFASDFNSGLPIIKKCHPHLVFGCSRQYRNTEPAYVVGDTTSLPPRTYSTNQGGYEGGLLNFSSRGTLVTTVNSYRHVDYSGFAQPELILLNGNAFSSSGAPILDKYGQVIGMQTLATSGSFEVNDSPLYEKYIGNGAIGGPSQFSMIRSLTLLDQAAKGFVVPQAELIIDAHTSTSFYLLGHGYLGLAWDLVTGATYGTRVSNGDGYLTSVMKTNNSDFTNGPNKKPVIGYRVRALAGQLDPATPAPPGLLSLVRYIAVPGATQNVAGSPYINFVDSPLLGAVKPNDIIYDINCMPIGDVGTQAALSLALWALQPGSDVSLKVRVATQPPLSDDNYNVDKSVNVKLAKMPRWVNFPWYKYSDLPVAKLFNSVENGLLTNMPEIVVDTVSSATRPFFPSI